MSTEKLAQKVHKVLTSYLDYDQSQNPHIKGKEINGWLLQVVPSICTCY